MFDERLPKIKPVQPKTTMYYIYSLITAPGVVLHELGHAIFCIFSGVRIHRIKLFQFGKIAGFVEHEEPHKFYQAVLVSFGPLILNSLVTLLAFSQITLIPFNQSSFLHPKILILAWLGIVSGLHAIPSFGDAKTLLSITNTKIWRNPFKILGFPLILLLYFLNLLKRWHIHFLYTAFLIWLGSVYLK